MDGKKEKKKGIFDLNSLTSREFQSFLIILEFEGNSIPVLKTKIKNQFKHKSRTKAYDYINGLCNKGLVYKKKITENGKNYVNIHVNKKIRSEYEKLIVPTLSSTKNTVKELLQDNLDIIEDMDKNREKYKNYTETILTDIKDLIATTPINAIKNKRFQKKIDDHIWTFYRAEMLKSEMFSKKIPKLNL